MVIRMKLKSIIFMLLVSYMLAMLGGCGKAATETQDTGSQKDETVYTTETPDTPTGPEGMRLVAEDGGLRLYADVATGVIGVEVVETGKIWMSNPGEAETDEKASPLAKSQLMSQLIISYKDANANDLTMNSYDDCVKAGQLSYALTDRGIRFQYVLGEMEESLLIPRWISEERMNVFLDKMTEQARKKVLRQYSYINLKEAKDSEKKELAEKYPAAQKHNLYVLRDNSEFLQQELMQYFGPAGYTLSDLQQDSEENGFESSRTKPYFVIVMEYALENGRFTASIPAGVTQFDKSQFPLTDISMLPYFGSAYRGHEGYLFVPDGSGALIHFDNGRTGSGAYIQPVYGVDTAFGQASQLEANQQFSIRMPVYGIKDGEDAFVAVIDEGDAMATIQADISGKQHSFNFVSPAFRFLPYGRVSVGRVMDDSNKLYMYAQQPYQGNYRLSFDFLHGEKADYMGMAESYRRRLLERGVLKQPVTGGKLPFYVEFIGAVSLDKKVLGIPYNASQALTSYAQAREILEALAQRGVDGVQVIYSGWYNGGLGGTSAINPDEVQKLGRDLPLKEFQSYLEGKGIPAFFGTDIQYVYRDKAGDGFSIQDFAPRYFDKKTIRLLAGADKSAKQESAVAAYLVSPAKIAGVARSFLRGSGSLGLKGWYPGSLSYELFSDFTQGQQSNRQQAAKQNTEALALLGKSAPLLGDNANAYAFGELSGMVNAPLFSNLFAIIDEQVPFYQAALHGYLSYAGEPLNLAPDYREVLLKSVETGASPYFKWIYEDNALLKETAFEHLYSVHYKAWLEDASQLYQRADEALSGVVDQVMTEHRKLQDNVYKTTYANGTEVYVNYGRQKVETDGVTIPPKDFIAVKGE